MEILRHAHSGLRWLVLALLIAAIVKAFTSKKSGKAMTAEDKKMPLFALIATHTQILLGLIMYFESAKVVFSADTMKNSMTRFYTMEHILLMVIAAILITIGYSKAKKSGNWKPVFTYYLIGLILILASIPWPFRNLGAGWF